MTSTDKPQKIASVGPAGLRAALEPLRRSAISPIVFEYDIQGGGISNMRCPQARRLNPSGHPCLEIADREPGIEVQPADRIFDAVMSLTLQ